MTLEIFNKLNRNNKNKKHELDLFRNNDFFLVFIKKNGVFSNKRVILSFSIFLGSQ